MEQQELLAQMNSRLPAFIGLLGGKVIAVDPAEMSCTFEFDISTDYCHSVNIVQGGFITSMLDSAMSHSVFAGLENVNGLSSLEIKTSYLESTNAGKLRAVGKVVKAGYKIAFLEASLYNEDGVLTATASSVAKIVRAG
jgi:uncharacterized protein (TIGR00369 family)